MMDGEFQLKLQAFLDAELPEKEAREIAAWIARDAEAADLLAELRHTRQALAGFEPKPRLPEARDFYWSKIEREIQRRESQPDSAESIPVFSRLRRLLLPAAAVATLAMIVTFAVMRPGVPGVPDTETTLGDSATFTYHDYANGTTLVWLDYPAEREFANNGVH